MGHWSLSRQLHWSWGLGLVSILCYFLVVLVYYMLHIVHTTVADLDVVFVKKAVIFMMSWEMSRD